MANCYLFDIVEPDPESLDVEVWRNVLRLMDGYKWIRERGNRIGFVSTLDYNGLVAGLYANEGRRRGTQYTDDKKPLDVSNFYSFEHLFFAILVDTSQILLQHRNIYGYETLGMPEMRANFLEILAMFLRLSNVGIVGNRVKIESAGDAYTQEELFTYFIENQTIKVDIHNLDSNKIPQENEGNYKLYNPRDEWNPITWGAVAETLKVGTRNVVFEASQEDSTANISRGPLPKAFAVIGDIEEVSVRSPDGYIIVRKKVKDEEIIIGLPADPFISIPVLDEILTKLNTQTRVESWVERMNKRRKAQLKGTLFDHPTE